MRAILRHCSPFIRSRRRISFIFTIGILLSLIGILSYINNNNHHQQLTHLPTTISQQTNKTISIEKKTGGWPIDDKGRSLKTNFLALDWNGFFGSAVGENERVYCASSNTTVIWTRQQNRIDDIDFVISHDGQSNIPFERLQLNENKQQYSMAYVMESEVHSSTGNGWSRFNFKMTYNLNDSYPEPATYFDVNPFIIDLLQPPRVEFDKKEKQADIVWIISNCNSHNGREGFVQRLMEEMKVDSYGSCLNNRQGYGGRMTDNINAYEKYKFVITIENSNCMDYITEKLVKAIESGSIPIVAGRDGRPDYRRYLPKHSYINIFDYPTIKDLANDLKRIANNRTIYESYLWYKKHNISMDEIKQMTLDEKIKQLANIIGKDTTMMTEGIVGKERSENKICKLARFVRQTSWKEIAEHQKTVRADSSIACLPSKHIVSYFNRRKA